MKRGSKLLVAAALLAVASAGASGVVVFRRWWIGRAPLVVLKGHTGAIRGVVFSPDGRRVYSAGDDGRVAVHDPVANASTLFELNNSSTRTSLALDPSGRTLAVGSAVALVELLDLERPNHDVRWVRWVPRIDAHEPEPEMDAVTSVHLLQALERRPQVWSLAFSPAGDLVAAEDDLGHVVLLSTKDGSIVRTLETPCGRVYATAFSPTGELLAAGGLAGKVGLISCRDGRLVKTIDAHEKPVGSLVWSPHGDVIATASDDGNVRLWSAAGDPLVSIPGFAGKACLAFSPAGDRLACGAWKWVRVVSVPDGATLAVRAVDEGNVTRVAFSPDGERIAAAMRDGSIDIWRAPP
jgi:WD40 repeat protein